MGCAIVATVSAGMAGQGTHVKSGWEQSTEEERGGLAARSNQSTTHHHHHHQKTKLNMDVILHIIYRIHSFVVLFTSYPYETGCCRCKTNINITM